MMFFLPHVLGHQGSVVPAYARIHLLTAITRVQLMLIASRGLRQYTVPEFRQIYDEGYIAVFRCMELIHQAHHDRVFARKSARHAKKPDKNPRPKRYCSNHRRYKPVALSDTSTDSTDEEFQVGGLHYYSHGILNLVHQHWPLQVQSAGSFRVHNTEAAEGKHKTCMTLPAKRVRHFDTNRTFTGMQSYLQDNLLFTTLDQRTSRNTSARTIKPGVNLPLRRLLGNLITNVTMGTDLESVRQQTSFIHDEVRVARLELLDLLCHKLGLPKTQSSYTKLEGVQWSFGQKMVLSCGTTYWATDTQYAYYTNHNSRRRRDNFLLHGFEEKIVRGRRVKTALCCQAVCFLHLQSFAHLNLDIPAHVKPWIVDDSLSLILVRWFSAHPTATDRNSLGLPLCPGPLRDNHALWRYSKLPKDRPVLLKNGRPSRYFDEQSFIFGKTRAQQLKCLESESRAYYDLIRPCEIQKKIHICPEFVADSHTHSDTWLQTINLPM